MTTATVRENETTTFTLSDNQAASLLELGKQLASTKSWWGDAGTPQPEDERHDTRVIRCLSRGANQYDVAVDDAIGMVVVENLTIIVQPKIPLDHFVHIASHSDLLPRIGSTKGGLLEAKSLVELIATWFLSAVEKIVRADLIHDYEETTGALSFVRGHPQLERTARSFYTGRLDVECRYDEFTVDTPLNRIVRSALALVLGSPIFPRETRSRARSLLGRFGEVSDVQARDFSAALTARTLHYRDGITLAKHLLRWTGRTLATGMQASWSFLIPTPILIERGLLNILRHALKRDCIVEKSGRQLIGSPMTINPDIHFRGCEAVADVKYKLYSFWNRADLYQSVAFAVGFHYERSAVISFMDSTSALLPWVRIGDIRVAHIPWVLSPNDSPATSQGVFVAAISSWLKPSAVQAAS